MESLARGGPWRMGTVVRGISKWRVLSEAETEIYGGSSLRRLYGCTFNMQPAQAPLLASGSIGITRSELETACKEPALEYDQQLLTWSQVQWSRIWQF